MNNRKLFVLGNVVGLRARDRKLIDYWNAAQVPMHAPAMSFNMVFCFCFIIDKTLAL